MKKRIPFILALLFFTGCASMLPPIREQHPDGYAKLILIKPECQQADLNTYTACLAAADLLESTSPEQVTAKFLSHWEKAAFGEAYRRRNVGETRYMPGDAVMETVVWGKVRHDDILATKNIVLPVLKKIYSDNNNDYSNKMLKQADLTILDSRSSFDSFREAHSRLMN